MESDNPFYYEFCLAFLTKSATLQQPSIANTNQFMAKTNPRQSFKRSILKPNTNILVIKIDDNYEGTLLEKVNELKNLAMFTSFNEVYFFASEKPAFLEDQLKEFRKIKIEASITIQDNSSDKILVEGNMRFKELCNSIEKNKPRLESNKVSLENLIKSIATEATKDESYKNDIEAMANVAFVTPILITICIVSYISVGLNQSNDLFNLISGSLHNEYVAENFALSAMHAHEYPGFFYRVITSQFHHYGLMHIIFNLLALSWIGATTEKVFGTARFVTICFFSAICTSVTSAVLNCLFEGIVFSAGFSGILCGLIGARISLLISRRGADKSGLERDEEKEVLNTILLTGLFGIFYEGIDNYAHLGGLLGGLISGSLLLRKIPTKEPLLPKLKPQLTILALIFSSVFILLEARLFLEKNTLVNRAHFYSEMHEHVENVQAFDDWIIQLNSARFIRDLDEDDITINMRKALVFRDALATFNYRSPEVKKLKQNFTHVLDLSEEMTKVILSDANELQKNKIDSLFEEHKRLISDLEENSSKLENDVEKYTQSGSLFVRFSNWAISLFDRYK